MKRALLGVSAGKAGWQHIVGALDHLLTKVLTFSRLEMESFQGHLRWGNSKITSRFGCFSDGRDWKTVKARKRIVIQQDMLGTVLWQCCEDEEEAERMQENFSDEHWGSDMSIKYLV